MPNTDRLFRYIYLTAGLVFVIKLAISLANSLKSGSVFLELDLPP
jgi:hypothetical protein